MHKRHTSLRVLLQRLFPQASLAVAEWTQGIPAYSVDRLFCAGAVPGIHGLYRYRGDERELPCILGSLVIVYNHPI